MGNQFAWNLNRVADPVQHLHPLSSSRSSLTRKELRLSGSESYYSTRPTARRLLTPIASLTMRRLSSLRFITSTRAKARDARSDEDAAGRSASSGATAAAPHLLPQTSASSAAGEESAAEGGHNSALVDVTTDG